MSFPSVLPKAADVDVSSILIAMVIVFVVATLALSWWVMILWGAIASFHGFTTIGLGESWLWLALTAQVGFVFNFLKTGRVK